ncbi:Nitroreductase domain-containing protein, partial [Dysosmobacter welbionis]
GRELPHLPLVIPVRAAVRQRVRKGVAARKGAPGHGVEAVRLQRGTQLRQGVVVGPVAEGDHPHRQGAVPVDLLLDIGQHLV